MSQIIGIAKQIDFGKKNVIFYSTFAVFTNDEVQIIFEVLKPLVGDLVRDQGMGHVIPAWYLEFSGILKRHGYHVRYEFFESDVPRLCFTPL